MRQRGSDKMARKDDPAQDEAQVTADAPAAEDTITAPGVSREQIEALGLDPDKIDPSDPAITGISRDERHDSVDPHTGTLSDEAQALRREQAAEAEA